MYVGPIYAPDGAEEVCPWCISEGRAASQWSASFNGVHEAPNSVPQGVLEEVEFRTPGYETWQENRWLFSETDALVFLGEVIGSQILAEGDAAKIEACLNALSEWNLPADLELSEVVIGGQPAVYLFRDRATVGYRAFADMA